MYEQKPNYLLILVSCPFVFQVLNVRNDPVKHVTGIFSCLFDGSGVENETKSDGNPIIFLVNAMEIP